MKSIYFLIDNAFIHDARVVREAITLKKAGYNITVFALKEKGYSYFEYFEGIPVCRLFDSRIFDFKKITYHKQVAKKISKYMPDIIHCHDQSMLNIAVHIKKQLSNVMLIYDSHELFKYWPINYTSNATTWLKIKSWLVRKYEIHREQKNVKKINYLITVNQSIANVLKKEFRLSTTPTVIRNIPDNNEHNPNNTELSPIIKIAYIAAGIYPKSLNLEQALIELGSNKKVEIHLYGGYKGDPEYFKQLVKKHKLNVIFHGKILPQYIITSLQTCHVGLVTTWNKKDLSYWLALDNKLFHYIHADLPILSTSQPEYVEIVEKFNIGICINPEKTTFLEGLNIILQNYQEYKRHIAKAKEELTWNNESKKLLNLYNEICTK